MQTVVKFRAWALLMASWSSLLFLITDWNFGILEQYRRVQVVLHPCEPADAVQSIVTLGVHPGTGICYSCLAVSQI